MSPEHTTPVRSAPDLEALRAAVARIERGDPASSRPHGVSARTVSGERAASDEAGGVVGASETDEAPGTGEALGTDEATGVVDAGERRPGGAEPAGEADPYAVARGVVLRQLAMAPRSRQQLRDKLRRRDCPDQVAEAVLDRMAEVGLVDDEKFAEALVRSKQVTRGLSRRGLAHELRTTGVDRETADSVLAQVSETDEEQRARALVEARLPRLLGVGRDVAMRRLAGMLARKGYGAGLSLRVIREAVDAHPAFRRD
jgi:regulatory protein